MLRAYWFKLVGRTFEGPWVELSLNHFQMRFISPTSNKQLVKCNNEANGHSISLNPVAPDSPYLTLLRCILDVERSRNQKQRSELF